MPILESQFQNERGQTVRIFRPTPDEIAAQAAQEEYDTAMAACLENRRLAYEALGWISEFDVIDDIMRRGIDPVMADRAAVKQAWPKPDNPA